MVNRAAVRSQTFNDLLEAVGIDPTEVRLLRHQTRPGIGGRTLAELWARDRAGFELYQSTQKAGRRLFRTGSVWASFVSPAPDETLFVGLYDARFQGTEVVAWNCPYRGGTPGDGAPVDVFKTSLRDELAAQIGALEVTWDKASVRSWARYAVDAPLPFAMAPHGVAADAHELGIALESFGFRTTHQTLKVRQMVRGRLTVYLKRETTRQPLVLHPRYFDLAPQLGAIPGVSFDRPLKSYINSNLSDFPEFVSSHRRTPSRFGFAVAARPSSLPHLISCLERGAVISSGLGDVPVVGNTDFPITEHQRLQAARIGQGDFRAAVIAMWQGACPVAGVDQLELLRASHIKPWKDASNRERLDPFNGLLLCAHVDALFDRGLISFTNEGCMIVSSELRPSTLRQLGLNIEARISSLSYSHRPYLEFHRTKVFRA